MNEFKIVDLKKLDVPACFDSQEQYRTWKHSPCEKNDLNKNGYCCDCTPWYQSRMKAAERCAYPDTFFVLDVDGFIEGRRYIEGSKTNDPARVNTDELNAARDYIDRLSATNNAITR